MRVEGIATGLVGVTEKIPEKRVPEMGVGGNAGRVPHKSKPGQGAGRSSGLGLEFLVSAPLTTRAQLAGNDRGSQWLDL